jgi:predicted nucleotidyltransferase
MVDISTILPSSEYDFIKTDEHLGRHVIILGLAGSYSYGTNNENSDIDVRGVTLNRRSDLIGLTSYEQYVDANTDTTIFTFNKMISLLLNCNPNTLELLGLKPEHYLYLNDIGKSLIEHTNLFLSKRAIQSFGGYADAQLRRLQNSNKHAMHLVRLFMMAIDILNKGEINTFRRDEHELLLSIRRGEYQKSDGTFSKEFYEIVSEYESKLSEATKNTKLPDEPDMEKVEKYVMSVNTKVVHDDI